MTWVKIITNGYCMVQDLITFPFLEKCKQEIKKKRLVSQ